MIYYGASGSAKFPTFMVPPLGVVNDGWRRIMLISNDGYNPNDAASTGPTAGYPSFQARARALNSHTSAAFLRIDFVP